MVVVQWQGTLPWRCEGADYAATKAKRELTVGWQGELKLYTLHHTPNHTNSNTLECLRTPPKHFFVYFILLEFNDSWNAYPRDLWRWTKLKCKREWVPDILVWRLQSRLTISQGIFLKRKERVILEQQTKMLRQTKLKASESGYQIYWCEDHSQNWL